MPLGHNTRSEFIKIQEIILCDGEASMLSRINIELLMVYSHIFFCDFSFYLFDLACINLDPHQNLPTKQHSRTLAKVPVLSNDLAVTQGWD